MPDSKSQIFSAKRTTWNATLLMLRSAIGIVVGLFTSRIVYNALGVEDYGINAVVGGILPFFTFISASLSAATSRFLTFEIGKGDIGKIRATFTAAFYTHIVLALLVAVVCEIGGLYLLNHQLQIPAGRELASLITLQCAILGIFVNITQVPYNAVLIANERFAVYAYLGLLGSFGGLISAFLVKYIETDKLILYVILSMVCGLGIALGTRLYCIRHHRESHLLPKVHFGILRPILSYSMWDFLGSFCSSLYDQSRNYLVNIFFGVRYNTTTSVANTVYGSVASLIVPLRTGYTPQITKQYAQGNLSEMERVIKISLKHSFIVLSFISIPCFFNAEAIFLFWLGSVPQAAPFVLRCLLIFGIIYNMTGPFITVVQAVGKLKFYSIANGVLSLLLFGLVYVIYHRTRVYEYGFIAMVMGQLLFLSVCLVVTKRNIPQLRILHIFSPIGKLFMVILVNGIMIYFICQYMADNIVQIILSTTASTLVLSILTYTIILDTQERKTIVTVIKARIANILTIFR